MLFHIHHKIIIVIVTGDYLICSSMHSPAANAMRTSKVTSIHSKSINQSTVIRRVRRFLPNQYSYIRKITVCKRCPSLDSALDVHDADAFVVLFVVLRPVAVGEVHLLEDLPARRLHHEVDADGPPHHVQSAALQRRQRHPVAAVLSSVRACGRCDSKQVNSQRVDAIISNETPTPEEYSSKFSPVTPFAFGMIFMYDC